MYNHAYCYGVRNTFQTAGSSMRLVRPSQDTEKNVIVLPTSFAHAGNSKRRVKYEIYIHVKYIYIGGSTEF